MQPIADLFEALDGGGPNLPTVRDGIISLLLEHLHALRRTPAHWEKTHFANAVAALGMNIQAVNQPNQAWLRLCLVDLAKAIESIQPAAPYQPTDRQLDAVTIEELIATVEALCEQTTPMPASDACRAV